MSKFRHSAFLLGTMLCCVASPAMAQTNVMVLDTFIETHRIENQSASWQTITLANSYTAPVVVCSYVLPSASDNEGHTRLEMWDRRLLNYAFSGLKIHPRLPHQMCIALLSRQARIRLPMDEILKLELFCQTAQMDLR